MESRTWFRSASERSSASTSASVRAPGRSSASAFLITSGTAAAVSSSSEPYPTWASIFARASWSGPMWRCSNGIPCSSSESGLRWAVIAEASWSDATFEGHHGTGTRTASPSVIST
ncbi:hypothetical protein SALBM311S_04578 [Streptomyces alboniger]